MKTLSRKQIEWIIASGLFLLVVLAFLYANKTVRIFSQEEVNEINKKAVQQAPPKK